METPIKTLDQLQKEADAAIAALEQGKKEAAKATKTDIANHIKDALALYAKLPDGAELLKDVETPFADAIKALGVRSSRGGTRSGGSFDEAAILGLLGNEGKFEDEVLAHFGVKKQNGGSWRKKLAGKVDFDKVKPEGGKHKKYFWRKIKSA